MACLSRSYLSRIFKGYLPQIFLVHSWILCPIYLLEKQLLFWKSVAKFHNKYYFLKSPLEVYIRFWQIFEQILVQFYLGLRPFQDLYLPVFNLWVRADSALISLFVLISIFVDQFQLSIFNFPTSPLVDMILSV